MNVIVPALPLCCGGKCGYNIYILYPKGQYVLCKIWFPVGLNGASDIYYHLNLCKAA